MRHFAKIWKLPKIEPAYWYEWGLNVQGFFKARKEVQCLHSIRKMLHFSCTFKSIPILLLNKLLPIKVQFCKFLFSRWGVCRLVGKWDHSHCYSDHASCSVDVHEDEYVHSADKTSLLTINIQYSIKKKDIIFSLWSSSSCFEPGGRSLLNVTRF